MQECNFSQNLTFQSVVVTLKISDHQNLINLSPSQQCTYVNLVRMDPLLFVCFVAFDQ